MRAFATREQATGRLVGGCELRIKASGPAHVSYWTNATGQLTADRATALTSTTAGTSVRAGLNMVTVSGTTNPGRR